MPSGRSFTSNLCLIFSILLLANGVYSISSPYANLYICWYLIVDSLLLLLVIHEDPPILAVVFELATMARLPDYLANYNDDPAMWKVAAVPIVVSNAGILSYCYFFYYAGTWFVGKRSTTAAGQPKFPKLLSGLNPLLEMLILFSGNITLMMLVGTLQFQEHYVKVISGLMMILFSGLCLIPSWVLFMMGRTIEAVKACATIFTARYWRPRAAADQEEPEVGSSAVAAADQSV